MRDLSAVRARCLRCDELEALDAAALCSRCQGAAGLLTRAAPVRVRYTVGPLLVAALAASLATAAGLCLAAGLMK